MSNDVIIQRIILDGAKDIAADLKRIGDAARQAFAQLQTAAGGGNGPLGAIEASAKRAGISIEEMQARVAAARSGVVGLGQSIQEAAASTQQAASQLLNSAKGAEQVATSAVKAASGLAQTAAAAGQLASTAVGAEKAASGAQAAASALSSVGKAAAVAAGGAAAVAQSVSQVGQATAGAAQATGLLGRLLRAFGGDANAAARDVGTASDGAVQFARNLRLIGRAAGVGEISALGKQVNALGRAFKVAAPAIAAFGLGKLAGSASEASAEFTDLLAKSGLSRANFQAMADAGAGAGLSIQEMGSTLGNVRSLIEKAAQATKQNEEATAKYRDTITESKKRADELATGFEKINQSQSDLAQALASGSINTEQYLQGMRGLSDESRKLSDAIDEQDRQTRKAQRAMQLANIEAINSAGILQKLGVSALDSSGKLKKSDQALRSIADALARVGPGAERDQLEFELIASGINRDLLPALRRGAQGFADLQAQGKEIRPKLDVNADKALNDFAVSAGKLGEAFGALKDQVGAAVAPAFTAFMEKVRDILVEIRPALVEFGKAMKDVLGPVFTFIADTIKSVIVPAFKGLGQIADDIAKKINSFFGNKTSITGMQLLAGAAVALFGALAVIPGIIALVSGALTSIGGIITIAALAIGGFVSLLSKSDFGKSFSSALSSIGKTASDVWKSITDSFNGLVQFFADIPSKIGGYFSGLWESVKSLASDAVTSVQSVWGQIVTFFADIGTSIANAFTVLWDSVQLAAGNAVQWVTDRWNSVVSFFSDLGSQISEAISGVWDFLVQGAVESADWITEKFNEFLQFMTDLWEQIKALPQRVWDSIVSGVSDMWDRIKGIWRAAVDSVKSMLQPLIDLWNKLTSSAQAAGAAQAGAGGASQGFAGGGYVTGPGTTTSDSIAARLSVGEFVQRARAVRAYGRDFMHAINSLRIDPAAVHALMANGVASLLPPPVPSLHFAAGGMVPELAPARVTSALRPINLTIGDTTFAGLLAPEDVASSISQFAARKQVTSAGRKPGYYGAGR